MIKRLTPREKALAAAGLVTAGLVLFWALVLAPAREETARLDRAAVKRQEDLAVLAKLVVQYRALAQTRGDISGAAVREGRGFSLAGQVEELIAQAGLKDRIVRLQPLPQETLPGGLTRSGLEVRLREAPWSGLVRLLHGLEYGQPPLTVARFGLTSAAQGVDVSLRVEALIKP